MNERLYLLRLAVVMSLVLFVATGCPDRNTFVEPQAPEVTVARPQVRDIVYYLDFTGRTEAVETVEVRARVKGFLDAVLFKPSQVVQKGTLLFQIEPESFQAALDSAEADASAAKATYDLAVVTHDRAKKAFDKGALTDLELRQTAAERDAAKAAYDSMLASVDVAKLDLSYTTIHAPVTGRVSRDYVSVGNLVGSTEPTLLTSMVVDDPIYAYFNVDERFLLENSRRIDRSNPKESPNRMSRVELQFADGVDYGLAGEVDFGDNRVDPNTGTLQARAVFQNPNGELFPGLFVRVRFPRPLSDAILVPELALQRDIVGNFLFVVDDQGVVQRRDVVLGPRIGTERVVESGIDQMERVIVNGLQRARQGSTVTAVPEGTPREPPVLPPQLRGNG
jgi:RND family efflux transporter MFP subunit